MTTEISSFKRKFHRSLEPFKVMLVNKRIDMPEREWEEFVERIKESVIRNPDQYLGNELPSPQTLRMIVHEIFDEFIKRERSFCD